MGIDLPEDEILHLLDIYNGDISAVLSHIYDNNWLFSLKYFDFKKQQWKKPYKGKSDFIYKFKAEKTRK